jgi:hypothetical protein
MSCNVTGAGRIPQLFRLTGLDRAFADDRHWEAALTSEGFNSEECCGKHELL